MNKANHPMRTVNFRDLPANVLQSAGGVKKNWFDMTDPGLKKQVDKHAQHLLDGEFDRLASYYNSILPVFRGDDLVLINGRIELLRFLEKFRNHLLASGVKHIQGEIIGAKSSLDGRFQNTVKWRYFDAEGNAVGFAQVLYYGTQRDGKSIIEVVNYQEFDERRSDVWNEFQTDQPKIKIVPTGRIQH